MPIQISDNPDPGIPIVLTPIPLDLVQTPLPDLSNFDDASPSETITVTASKIQGASDVSGGIGDTTADFQYNGVQYNVIKATTYDPTLSDGRTATVTPEILAAGTAGEATVAVPQGNAEKLGYIVTNPDGTLSVESAADAQAGSNVVADTVLGTVPTDAVAVIHGHIDRDFQDPDNASNGMVDNTSIGEGYGDTQSLSFTNPIPEGTVSQGQVGWHVIVDGQLEYIYPQGSMTQSQVQAMQSNLNTEQAKFQVQK